MVLPHLRLHHACAELEAVRGSQWGINYAEAFEIVLRAY